MLHTIKRAGLLFIIVGIAVGGAFMWRAGIQNVITPIVKRDLQTVTEALHPEKAASTSVVSILKKKVIATKPLRAGTSTGGAKLTIAGVFAETNRNRAVAGAPVLKENAALDALAKGKVEDMFRRQYFEHISPTGESIGSRAEGMYAYIVIGENLALGNFKNDADLVLAWMNSPGHRANILNTRFSEIGIAVGSGVYEGHTTWLAVQEFGLPASACPAPDTDLKSSIAAYENTIKTLNASAAAGRAELDAMHPQTKEEYAAYNAKVDEYNALAHEANALIEKVKSLVTKFNGQVKAYNACALAE